MTLSDVTLLTKKILIGFILVFIPLIILWLGIKLNLKLADDGQQATTPVNITSNK